MSTANLRGDPGDDRDQCARAGGGTWLREALQLAGLKRVELARALALNRPEITRILKDQRKVSLGEAETIAELLKIDRREVLPKFGFGVGSRSVVPASPAHLLSLLGDP